MASATIVHDTSEAVALCPALGLYLKPITKMTISVALPPLRQPGKSISNWEVMERLKAMAAGAGPGGAGVGRTQFSALRIAKSTMDFIRFEGEVENRALVKPFLACLDGKTIKLSGFADALRVRAAEFRPDFPSRHDWDSFFRDADDMNEALPGERPDTIHLKGLPCRWFAPRGGSAEAADATSASTSSSGSASASSGILSSTSGTTSGSISRSSSACERPSEALLRQAFGAFGDIRHVDIPMLDPYRGEAAGRSFHTFSFGGHLHFEAYVQYCEYAGFARAMGALRGMKLMLKGDDGKAVACNIKVSFDSTKHLSDASIRKRQLERQKLQELELQRQEQKRREKEADERRRQEEQRQHKVEAQERTRCQEQKPHHREQWQSDREQRRCRRRLEKLRAGIPGVQAKADVEVEAEDDKRKHTQRLLLVQRDLQSMRLVAVLLGRVEAAWLRQRQDEQRRLQEAELRRVEEEKRRALGLQLREQELRQRLLSLLLSRGTARPGSQDPGESVHGHSGTPHAQTTPSQATPSADLLRPMLDILHSMATRTGPLPANHRGPLGHNLAMPKKNAHRQSDAHTSTGEADKAEGVGAGPVSPYLSENAPSVTSHMTTPSASLCQEDVQGVDPEPRCRKRKAGSGDGGAKEGEEMLAGQQQKGKVGKQEPRRHHQGRSEEDRERSRSRLYHRGDQDRSRSSRRHTHSTWNH